MKDKLFKALNYIVIVCMTLGLFSGTYNVHAEENENKKTALEKLESATTITVKERLFTLNESYNIYADNEKVATVKGKYVSLTGDVFTLADLDGNEIASEKQIKRWNIKLNRLAEVFDSEGNTTGFIGEKVLKDLFKFGTTFHFFDVNKNEVAECREDVFNFLYKFNIKDNNDTKLYTINQKLSLTSKFEIDVLKKDSTVSVIDAIFVTCIMNEIRQANEKSK